MSRNFTLVRDSELIITLDSNIAVSAFISKYPNDINKIPLEVSNNQIIISRTIVNSLDINQKYYYRVNDSANNNILDGSLISKLSGNAQLYATVISSNTHSVIDDIQREITDLSNKLNTHIIYDTITRVDFLNQSSNWNCTHTLNRIPHVDVYLDTGELVYTDIQTTINTINVTFPSPQKGFIVYR